MVARGVFKCFVRARRFLRGEGERSQGPGRSPRIYRYSHNFPACCFFAYWGILLFLCALFFCRPSRICSHAFTGLASGFKSLFVLRVVMLFFMKQQPLTRFLFSSNFKQTKTIFFSSASCVCDASIARCSCYFILFCRR